MARLEKLLSADSDSKYEAESPPHLPPKLDPSVSTGSNGKLAGSLMFNMSKAKRNIRSLHPSAETVSVLWEYYVCNVDTLVNILYKPMVRSLITSAFTDLAVIDASTEALLFAIYFSTVTTMSAEECLKLQGEEKAVLLQRYRLALEQALARADWMTTQELVVLQASILLIVSHDLSLLILLLECLTEGLQACSPGRNTRSIWMLSGTAMGIAQAMGMHRDSASFSLSIVDTEVRRRVWWTLCVLDNRISEGCGLETHVPMTMDTKLPLHINDSDIDVTSTETPIPKTEFTEMTVSLVKMEMAEIILRIKSWQNGKFHLSTEEVETLVRERTRRFEDTYLKYLDASSSLHHFCYLGTRLIIAKLWKMIYDLFQQHNLTEGQEIEDWLLWYHTEVLEITHQLPDKSAQFGWFFICKYTQWHAMAYLLIELCQQTTGPVVDRAWAVLDAIFGDFKDGNESTLPAGINVDRRTLWETLQKLFKRARHVRKQSAGQALLQVPELSDASTPNIPNETNHVRNKESLQTSTGDKALLGDPFLGSPDFGEEMDWEDWNILQSFQTDLLLQRDRMKYQESNRSMILGW